MWPSQGPPRGTTLLLFKIWFMLCRGRTWDLCQGAESSCRSSHQPTYHLFLTPKQHAFYLNLNCGSVDGKKDQGLAPALVIQPYRMSSSMEVMKGQPTWGPAINVGHGHMAHATPTSEIRRYIRANCAPNPSMHPE
jgi:hypothetical protein